MRHETRIRLDRELRFRRMKIAGGILAVLLLAGTGFMLVDLDAHEKTEKLVGTVDNVHTFAGKGAIDGLEVGVKLEDGRHVKVLTHKARDPHVGDHIEVTEHRHLTGRTTFTFR